MEDTESHTSAGDIPTRSPRGIPHLLRDRVTGRATRLTCALALQIAAMWGAGSFWYFAAKPFFAGWPLFAALAGSCIVLAALALLAARRPSCCAALPRWRHAACVAAPCFAALAAAVATDAPATVGIGAAGFICACMGCWACLTFSLLCCATSLVRLELGERLACVAVASAAAIAVRGLAQGLIATGRGVWLLAATMLACLAVCLLTSREADGVFRACAESATSQPTPADLELTQPASFLPLRHRLYLMLAPFGFAASLAFYFGIDSGFVNSTPLSVLPLAVIAVVGVKARRNLNLDVLLGVAFVMGTGAFLSIGFVLADFMQISVTLFGAAEACFYVLMFTMLASIARRNERNAVVVFAWGLCLYLLGWGPLGRTFDLLAHIFIYDVPLLTFPLAWLFVAFIAWVMHGFSVERAVRHVERGEQVTPAADPLCTNVSPTGAGDAEPGKTGGTSNGRLDALAAQGQLTEREREVFELLAHGRNARYLQEQLGISRNTAKTHIAHVYAKLGVHSQQELIDLVQ